MKTLIEIKTEKENKVSDLINECSMFFAFSNEQFNENKTPLQDGEKYVSMGMGAYMPKSKVDSYLSGIKEINKWYKATIKANKMRGENTTEANIRKQHLNRNLAAIIRRLDPQVYYQM